MRLKRRVAEMIGAMEKGIEAAQVAVPPVGTYEGVDLKTLPKYICFRAALLHNKLTLQYITLALSGLLLAQFAISRTEIYSLYGKLRTKEYILAPGVLDFTPASAQAVPDSYVADATTEYLNQLGNINARNVEEQYRILSDSMSPQLKVKFLADADGFKAQVKGENISELLTITEKQIRSSGSGSYQVTAFARRERYINNEYIGHIDEAIEMTLKLAPPKAGKRWFLEIQSLQRQNAETFRSKKKE